MYERLKFDKDRRNQITRLDGQYKIGPTGRLIPANPKGARAIPWIFLNQESRNKFCAVWNAGMCCTFNIIPSHCRFACWKIVIKPRNVKETFLCHDILQKMNYPSKIGMDRRVYTYGAWAGFIYTNSLEEGKRVWKHARAEIPDEISVILKRGCTEMERLRPSNTWDKITREEVEAEEELNDLFHFNELDFHQANWLKNEIKERWIEHAIEIGDPTARETAEKYSGDPNIWEKLVVQSVTYHEEDE